MKIIDILINKKQENEKKAEILRQHTIEDLKAGYYNNFELKDIFDLLEKHNIKFKDFM